MREPPQKQSARVKERTGRGEQGSSVPSVQTKAAGVNRGVEEPTSNGREWKGARQKRTVESDTQERKTERGKRNDERDPLASVRHTMATCPSKRRKERTHKRVRGVARRGQPIKHARHARAEAGGGPTRFATSPREGAPRGAVT